MQKTPKGKSKCKNCSFLVYEAAVVLGEMSSDFRMKFQSVKCLASTGNTQNFILFNLTFAASFEVPSDVAQQKRRVVSSKIRLYSSTHFSISIYLIWLLFHLNFSQFEYREFGISGSSIKFIYTTNFCFLWSLEQLFTYLLIILLFCGRYSWTFTTYYMYSTIPHRYISAYYS